MTTAAQLATVPSADTPQTCIRVRHEQAYYIFGRVAEGTQRAFNSRKFSFSSVNHIFLSGPVGWEQLGGLMGFLLSIGASVVASRDSAALNNAEREKRGRKAAPVTAHAGVNIHAGDNISHVMAAGRSFILRQPLRALISETRDDPRAADPTDTRPDWEDGMIRVWKVPATRERSSSPLKRRHMSPTDNGAESQGQAPDFDESLKDPEPLSDSEVARHIAENAIWSGQLRVPLVATKVGDLVPGDTAFLIENGSTRMYTGPYHGDGEKVENPEATAWVLQPQSAGKLPPGAQTRGLHTIPLPRTSYSQQSMSYIVKSVDRRGKFNVAVARELGVHHLDFSKLINGTSVQGKDGTTVTQEMVLGDSTPGRGFIVADIPGPDYLEPFMQRPEWSNDELMANIPVMYWLLGPGLAGNARIQKFIQDHPDIKHTICAPETVPNMVTNPVPAELQMKLRRVDPERFPIPKYNNVVSAPAPAADSNVEFGRAGLSTQLMPRLLHQDDAVAPFPDLAEPYNSVHGEALTLAEEARAKVSDPAFLAKIEESEKDIPNRDAEIVCLGTGSSVPSMYRNVSATLIRVPGIGNYLLDCGEGTMGQARRLFGYEETANVLRDLKCVAISHLHADHHLGAPSVIKAWYDQQLKDGRNDRLAVVCVRRYRDTLWEMSQVEDVGFHRLHFPNCEPGSLRVATAEEHMGGHDFGLRATRLIPVPHCSESMAVELELSSGLRIAYSGDCRPSRQFAATCRGAHLLVHECTFDDDMAEHAVAKNHCTMSEALGVASDMRARRTLLTHFSQRYVKADAIQWESSNPDAEQSVLFGFDYMTVKLGDFQKASCFLPAVGKVMSEMTSG